METCHSSFRNENEISTVAVMRFYQFKERHFDDALDAIVAGCVTEYTFNIKDKKFEGTVTSFDGNESYKVKIFVTDDFTILSTFCDCLQQSCYHTGAVALHSGFKAPIFSRLPNEEDEATTTTITDDNAPLGNENEIEFIDLKADQNKDYINGVFTSEEQHDPTEQMFVDDTNPDVADEICTTRVSTEAHHDPISTPKQKRKRSRYQTLLRKKNVDEEFLEWKTLPSPLIITQDQWSDTFDSKTNQFNNQSTNVFMDKLNNQFENIACSLRSEGQYVTANNHGLRFKCTDNGCSRFYSLSINRMQIESENYAFEVRHLGKLKHVELSKNE